MQIVYAGENGRLDLLLLTVAGESITGDTVNFYLQNKNSHWWNGQTLAWGIDGTKHVAIEGGYISVGAWCGWIPAAAWTAGEKYHVDAVCVQNAHLPAADSVMCVLRPPTIEEIVAAVVEAGGSMPAILPLAATYIAPMFSTLGAEVRDLAMPQHAAATFTWAIHDSANTAIDLSSALCRFVAYDREGVTIFTRETAGNGITVAGDDDNQVAVAIGATQTAAAGKFFYKLWDITGARLLASGELNILFAPIA